MKEYRASFTYVVLTLLIVGICFISKKANSLFTEVINPFFLLNPFEQFRNVFAIFSSLEDSIFIAPLFVSYLGYVFWPTIFSASLTHVNAVKNFAIGVSVCSLAMLLLAFLLHGFGSWFVYIALCLALSPIIQGVVYALTWHLAKYYRSRKYA
jgi:hypothetical protein